MKILLFGVSNVGKTTIGELLAERLDFKFYDLDEEVKTRFGMTLDFWRPCFYIKILLLLR